MVVAAASPAAAARKPRRSSVAWRAATSACGAMAMNRCNCTRAMGRPPMMVVISGGNDGPGRISHLCDEPEHDGFVSRSECDVTVLLPHHRGPQRAGRQDGAEPEHEQH